MAKTGIFLRGSRGKFAGSVLYKGEQGTVIRENVKPSNPQSSSQMSQRVAFATVAAAAKVMLPVIGQTFQTSANEVVNRRRFMAQNVNALKAAFKDAPYAAAIPKGYPVLVPNRYIMSRGQLRLPTYMRLHQAHVGNTYGIGDGGCVWDLPVGTYTPQEVLLAVYEMLPGQQATFALACCSKTTRLYGSVDEGDYLRASRFIARRIVVKSDFTGVDSLTVTAETTLAQLKAYLLTLFDADKSDAILLDRFTTFETATFSATGIEHDGPWIEDWINDLNTYADSFVGGLAIILSQMVRGAWQYSNSDMVISFHTELTGESYYGLRFATAEPTYLKGSAADSMKFTQAGGSSNSVG